MEVSNESDDGPTAIEDTGMTPSVAPDSPQQPEDHTQEPASKKISRNARDVSVDMLGEDTLPRLSQNIYQTPQSGTTSSSGLSTAANGQPLAVIGGQGGAPPLDEQIAVITKAIQEPLVAGTKGYVISNKWLTEAQDRGTSANKSSKEAKDEVQPPVDSRDLVDTFLGDLKDAEGNRFVALKSGLILDKDIQILPETAWKQIVQWYGVLADSPDIIRWCHNTSEGDIENLQYELYPPIFTLVKLAWFPDGTSKDAMAQRDLPPVRIVASRHERFQNFLKRAKTAAHIKNSSVRLWTTAENVTTSLKNAGMPTPAQSRSASPAPGSLHAINIGDKLVLDLKIFSELPDGAATRVPDAKDETSNANYNGRSTLDTYGLARPGVLILEEQIGGPAGGEWISEASKTTLAQHGITKISSSTLKPTASGRSSPAPSGIMTRGRTKKNGRSKGVVGLSNLGNTCYMNAALQCVRAIKELTYYFLEDKYKEEINPNNPLGYGGDIAKVYASLLKEIYTQGTTSVSPRVFKSTVGRNAATFSGYGQQDSQEFLGWLLDALQEDLNRIQKKPYVEKPDSTDEMVNNEEKLRAFADQCWDIYKARNDSVITDLFAGMYKSTLHCPVCDKVSIIFDPWSNLTLQLPLESAYHHNVHFFPVRGRPITVEIDIPLNTTWTGFKEYIATKFKTDPKRLVAAEAYSGKFWKLFDDKQSIAEDKPQQADYIAFYELDHIPTNYPPKTSKYRSMLELDSEPEDELIPDTNSDESIAFPVFHRKPKGMRSNREPVGFPFVISLTRREMGDEEEILRKILAKINTLTTQDFLSEDDESPAEDDDDTMVINASDADSGSDSRIQAASLNGEDDFVDINSFPEKEDSHHPRISYPARDVEKRSKTNPKVLEEGEFIDNGLRNLFNIAIFKEGNESYPKGWQSLQEDSKKYKKLEDRIYQRDQSAAKSVASPMDQSARALVNDGSPDGSEDELSTNGARPSNGDSTGDDEDSRVNLSGVGYGKSQYSKRSNQKTYSRKAQRRQQKKNNSISLYDGSNSDPENETPDVPKPALLRTGEGIILEWRPEAWKEIFGDGDEFATYGTPEPIHPDPEAAERKVLRDRKSKQGVTLDECLDELEKEEILSEADAWYCPRCKEHRRASKKFELWAVPDILVIHLKRFTTNGRSKLNLQVDFPLEGLDMTRRVVVKEDGRELIYDLIGVDNHFGGLGGGHYTALAQNFEDSRWYDFNDSMASPKSDPSSQFSNAAYILFYRRRSSKPLGGPRFREMFASIDENLDNGDNGSTSSSRAASPSGEGQRLEDSSRGFSSAYQGAEVVHLAGNGGLQSTQRATTRSMGRMVHDPIDEDDILPSYEDSNNLPSTMDIDDASAATQIAPWTGHTPNWSFGDLRTTQSPTGADDDDSMNGNDNDSDRGHLILGENLYGNHNYSGQPGTPDDDNDSMVVGADIGSDYEHLEDESTEIKVIDSGHATSTWGGGRDDAQMLDDGPVHEIRP